MRSKILPTLLLLPAMIFAQGIDEGAVADNEPEAGRSTISIGDRFTIHSKVLQEDREIYLYFPPGLWGMDEDMTNLPVVYVLDGESQFQNTVATIDYLSTATNGNDVLPRSIIVGIPNTNRNRDLSPISETLGQDPTGNERTGGGQAFLEFITTELIPYVDLNYPTCTHRTLIGHSMGGLLAFEALLRKRDYFHNYIIIDPALGFADRSYLDQVVDTLSSADLSDEKLFIAAANNRPTFIAQENLQKDTSELLKQIDIPLSLLLEDMEQNDWQLDFSSKYYPEENHFSIPHPATYDAMKWIYDYYPFKEMTNYYHPDYASKDDLVEDLKSHYKSISAYMGCDIKPMQGYINSFAFGLGEFGRDDLAEDLMKYNILLHPKDAMMYNNLGYYYRNSGRDADAIEQFNKSLELQHNLDIQNARDLLLRE